jgi:hypothetical protein
MGKGRIGKQPGEPGFIIGLLLVNGIKQNNIFVFISNGMPSGEDFKIPLFRRRQRFYQPENLI